MYFIILFLLCQVVDGTTFIALKQHNIDQLIKAFHSVSDPVSSEYGKFWTQSMINDLVNPPQTQI